MKKLLAMIVSLAMALSMAIPAYADDAAEENLEAPTELTVAQVKMMKPVAKAASYTYTKIKVRWDKLEGVDGYKVYRATKKTGKYSLAYTTSNPGKLYYINTNRTCGKPYYYKVRAYKVIDGKTVYSR